MKKLISNPWVMGIFFFALIRIALGLIFDLSPECHDGWHSLSIGKQGACSHHGGVDRSAGFVAFFISIVCSIIITRIFINWISSKRNTKESRNTLRLATADHSAPDCKKHGRMIAILHENGTRTWLCKRYPKCANIHGVVIPNCPSCNRKMVAVFNEYRITEWRCSQYPECPYIRIKSKWWRYYYCSGPTNLNRRGGVFTPPAPIHLLVHHEFRLVFHGGLTRRGQQRQLYRRNIRGLVGLLLQVVHLQSLRW